MAKQKTDSDVEGQSRGREGREHGRGEENDQAQWGSRVPGQDGG